eukprot:s334_g15.t8
MRGKDRFLDFMGHCIFVGQFKQHVLLPRQHQAAACVNAALRSCNYLSHGLVGNEKQQHRACAPDFIPLNFSAHAPGMSTSGGLDPIIDLQVNLPGLAVVQISVDQKEDLPALLRITKTAILPRDRDKVSQLISPRGARPLRRGLSLRRAGLRCGDVLIAPQMPVPELASTSGSFAALSAGSVMTWGQDPQPGDDIVEGGEELQSGVVEITAHVSAFAALKADGTVSCWGSAATGGRTPAQLSQVKCIFHTDRAFAALCSDGSVVCWGDQLCGGDPGEAAKELQSEVEFIFSSSRVFAALKRSGAVVTWGEGLSGGKCGSVADRLREGVQHIYSTKGAFVAIKEDGDIVAWGSSVDGGDASRVASELRRQAIRDIYTTDSAFAAFMKDGSLVTWGNARNGGSSIGVAAEVLRRGGLRSIAAGEAAFAAICADGSVVAWGVPEWGGRCTSFFERLTEVRFLSATRRAFAAQRLDGAVICWGDAGSGANTEEVQGQLECDIGIVFSTARAFAALSLEGELVSWGSPGDGGDCAAARPLLTSGIRHIYATDGSFMAFTAEDAGVAWGDVGLRQHPQPEAEEPMANEQKRPLCLVWQFKDDSDDGAEAASPGAPSDALVQVPPPVQFASNWWRMLTYAGMTWYCFHSSQPDECQVCKSLKALICGESARKTTAWLRTICGYSTWVATDDAEAFTRQGRYVPLPLMQELNLHKIVCYGRRPIALRLTDLDDCLSHRLRKDTYSLWRKAVEESLLSLALAEGHGARICLPSPASDRLVLLMPCMTWTELLGPAKDTAL